MGGCRMYIFTEEISSINVLYIIFNFVDCDQHRGTEAIFKFNMDN